MPRLETEASLATRAVPLGERADPGRHDLERPADLLGQRRLCDPVPAAHVLVKFFPDWFYERFHVGRRLAEGMAWHFAFMWLFALNGLLYVALHLRQRRVAAPGPEPPDLRRGVPGRPPRPRHPPRARCPGGSSTGPSGWPIPG